jgi:hypothetical protein
MAEDSERLREIELSQASIIPTTPRPAKRVRLEIPDSTSIHGTAQSIMTTPLTLLYRAQASENAVNSTTDMEGTEAVSDMVLDAPESPSPAFRIPTSLPGMIFPLSLSPIQSQPLSPLRAPSSSPPPQVALPLPKPLHHERIEMAIIWYERTKREWLAQNPHVQPEDYRKARGKDFEKIQNLDYYRRRLPTER